MKGRCYSMNKRSPYSISFGRIPSQYISRSLMIEDIIESIRHNTVWKMRDKYIKADILIVDDIQAFAGKEASQEEFFQFFDTVHRNGKQIVLSSNVHPYKLEGLEERLLSRLVWGLVAEVTLPDIETRRMLIKGFALSYDIELLIYCRRKIVSKKNALIFCISLFSYLCF